MTKILIVVDHYPISPRVNKVRDSLIKLFPQSEVRVFAWNRNMKPVFEDYVTSFDQDLGYGNQLAKLFNLSKFKRALKDYNQYYQADYIHAIDLEMYLTADKIRMTNQKVIYEVYDIKFFANKVINRIREKLEQKVLRKNNDNIIFASPFFPEYYKDTLQMTNNYIVLNNKPNKILEMADEKTDISETLEIPENKKVVGFIGVVRYKEILDNLIEAIVQMDDYVLLLSGSGPDFIYFEDKVKRLGLENKVFMTGRFDLSDLSELYQETDIVWAAYPNKDTNVKYAVSNKFYESQVYNKPVIVSENTMLENLVRSDKLGYSVDPYSTESIIKVLKGIQKDGYSVTQESLYWEDEEINLLITYE